MEEHLDEAGFLWTQWENGQCSPTHTLQELAGGNEARLMAHLKALTVGGRRVAERLLIPALGEDDPERCRAASFVLLNQGEGENVEAVLQAFTVATTAHRQTVARALSLSERQGLSKHLQPMLAATDPDVLATTLEILAFRRTLPAEGLPQLYWHEVPRVRIAALNAAHATCMAEDALAIREALTAQFSSLRAAGVSLGLVRNRRDAFEACLDWNEAWDEAGQLARLAIAMGGERSELDGLIRLLERPELCRDILWALGFSGKVVAAEACLPWLREPGFANIAAEAFCAITGLELTEKYRVARKKARDDEDEELIPDPDAELEQPEPEAIGRWWAEARNRFDRETRYLGGKAFSTQVLLDALWNAPMRRRPVLALELAIRTQGRYQVEVSDFSHVQARQLEEARSASGGRFWTGSFRARMRH
ncbi:TIGR02270 family protein [Archangium violaceum]|uniref:TIGR02270 family protein n=1 Tax=Archangium violaceum TaxID=83451 RepID=UPI002B2A7F9F|nr:TIGR02270 family protein [Archangium gephyra]